MICAPPLLPLSVSLSAPDSGCIPIIVFGNAAIFVSFSAIVLAIKWTFYNSSQQSKKEFRIYVAGCHTNRYGVVQAHSAGNQEAQP